MLLGNATLQGVEASSAAWGGSAADALPWDSPVVAYVAQMQHSAIPTLGSASDRVNSSGTGGSKLVDLGIPAVRTDTNCVSLTLDISQRPRRTDLKSLGRIGSG